MGMEHAVTFPAASPPSWPAARDLLASHGFPVQVRMIDGELAFPDEEPPENWCELRLASRDGQVVTARRESDRVMLIVWGMRMQNWSRPGRRLLWAFAET